MVANKSLSSISTVLTEVLHEKEPNSYGSMDMYHVNYVLDGTNIEKPTNKRSE